MAPAVSDAECKASARSALLCVVIPATPFNTVNPRLTPIPTHRPIAARFLCSSVMGHSSMKVIIVR